MKINESLKLKIVEAVFDNDFTIFKNEFQKQKRVQNRSNPQCPEGMDERHFIRNDIHRRVYELLQSNLTEMAKEAEIMKLLEDYVDASVSIALENQIEEQIKESKIRLEEAKARIKL